jgi:hypothetical protein
MYLKSFRDAAVQAPPVTRVVEPDNSTEVHGNTSLRSVIHPFQIFPVFPDPTTQLELPGVSV